MRGATQKSTDPKAGLKIYNMTECTQEIGYLQYINSDKHLLQSPIKGCTAETAGTVRISETVVTAKRAEIRFM